MAAKRFAQTSAEQPPVGIGKTALYVEADHSANSAATSAERQLLVSAIPVDLRFQSIEQSGGSVLTAQQHGKTKPTMCAAGCDE